MNSHFDLGEVSPLRYFATIAVVVGLLFAFISGGEDDAPSFALRLLQWQLQSCLPMALMVLSQVLLARLGFFERLSTWLQLTLSGLLGASLFAPLALGIDALMRGDPVSWLELMDEFLGVVPPVVLCWLAINAPWVLGYRLSNADAQSGPPETTESSRGFEPGFFELLPKASRGELLYLQAELHYIAVVTSQGRTLILYNLRDAIADLGDTPGIQPHRSYWVAADQVKGLRRRGRQGVLRMSNGDDVPVSRRSLAAVESWYERQTDEAGEAAEGR